MTGRHRAILWMAPSRGPPAWAQRARGWKVAGVIKAHVRTVCSAYLVRVLCVGSLGVAAVFVCGCKTAVLMPVLKMMQLKADPSQALDWKVIEKQLVVNVDCECKFHFRVSRFLFGCDTRLSPHHPPILKLALGVTPFLLNKAVKKRQMKLKVVCRLIEFSTGIVCHILNFG